MSGKIDQLINEIGSKDLAIASNAIVRSALILEWDAQGYLDESVAEAFPQTDLYIHKPMDAEVSDLIYGLRNQIESLFISDELRMSAFWALGKSKRIEACGVILRFLSQTQIANDFFEKTDVLRVIAAQVGNSNFLEKNLEELKRLAKKLDLLVFSSVEEEGYRKLIINMFH